MLHGYNQGHNYIQGSIVLDSSHDMHKIAMLSDWSEYVDGKDYSYLTCYPLDESDFYVIAKHGMPLRCLVQGVSGLIVC